MSKNCYLVEHGYYQNFHPKPDLDSFLLLHALLKLPDLVHPD